MSAENMSMPAVTGRETAPRPGTGWGRQGGQGAFILMEEGGLQ